MANLYSIKEAISGLGRAKLSTFISVSTVTLLLFAMSVFFIISFNVERLVNTFNASIQIQAFISESFESDQIGELSAKIMDLKEVEKVQFKSKDEVLQEFKKEFGEELFDVLDENPLPSSLLIELGAAYNTADEMKKVSAKIASFTGIEDVIYHGEALAVLTKFARVSRMVNIAIIVLVAFGSLFIVSNTVRLIIYARRQIVETMKLVGATNTFIRTPFFLEGAMQGLFGGAIASVVVFFIFNLIKSLWFSVLQVPDYFFPIIIISGFFLGLFGSAIAVKKFL